ncbi:MAG TPA: ABC transporter ATP-binding protein [Ferrovibrio sp.]|jgi:putrescine transport system ATP-binding protein|uniref:ABC transporter ATP-binding protein n=1 Tax=Ferrovibrio sp. TaxID=1917215 RepID=UPI002B4B37CB|nr:ABC transporter ATP-binding protein [Ferrovibrio sp.]HLT79171.1 ABC transporter ATP-binding protein [Ferrovibrio sp.]
MPLLSVEGLCKQFGGETAVDHVNLTVESGESLVLLGPSGCGKSTLLRMIAGLEMPDAGRILLDGDDITQLPAHRRPVNMMFQSYALFPHLSVADNVAFGLRREGLPKAEIAHRVDEALSMLEIAAFAGRRPHQLSGGQQQRVALARALVKRPRLLLLDEPLAALDKRLRQQTQAELRRLNRQTGIAFVFVTHDNDEAMALADRIAVMRAGRICQIDHPRRIYDRPVDRFVASLLADINLFRADVDEIRDGLAWARCGELRLHFPRLHFPGGAPGTRLLGLRPEQIEIAREPTPPAANTASGIVSDIDYIGDMTTISVRLADGQVIRAAQLNALHEPLLELDQPVWLSWDPDALIPLADD